jgi:hypothetical protein
MKDERRCTATNRSGQRCRKAAILGGTVCRNQGGGAPQVKQKAAERLADLIDPDRALREAARLAYSDVRELVDPETGRLKPMREWADAVAAAVSSIEVTKRNLEAGDGKQEDVVKIRLWDKPKNLELLFKHLGIIKERHEVSGNWDKWEARLKAARLRVSKQSQEGR